MTSEEFSPSSSLNFTGWGCASRAGLAVELSCACCLQHFTEPVRLTGCGHSFCRACIIRYCKGRQRAGCPLCREGFELKDLRLCSHCHMETCSSPV
uniref:RING-type domain-containing protein n=1 Tax=Strix occidentalis caurina TaxID=311401 RepID=A0A8D0KTQ3_STROC